MGNQLPVKAIVVSAVGTNPNQQSLNLALTNPDGSVASTVKPQTAPANSVAADVATLKTDYNNLLAVLKTAGVLK